MKRKSSPQIIPSLEGWVTVYETGCSRWRVLSVNHQARRFLLLAFGSFEKVGREAIETAIKVLYPDAKPGIVPDDYSEIEAGREIVVGHVTLIIFGTVESYYRTKKHLVQEWGLW